MHIAILRISYSGLWCYGVYIGVLLIPKVVKGFSKVHKLLLMMSHEDDMWF